MINSSIFDTKEKPVAEVQLEELTRKYLLGDIDLEKYRREISLLRVRVDLRKMASKIKTGSLQGKLPENLIPPT